MSGNPTQTSPVTTAGNSEPQAIGLTPDPLPTLRTPSESHSTEDEYVAPLPILRPVRSAPPEPFGPDDESSIVLRESGEVHCFGVFVHKSDQMTVNEAPAEPPIEETEPILNPVVQQTAVQPSHGDCEAAMLCLSMILTMPQQRSLLRRPIGR